MSKDTQTDTTQLQNVFAFMKKLLAPPNEHEKQAQAAAAATPTTTIPTSPAVILPPAYGDVRETTRWKQTAARAQRTSEANKTETELGPTNTPTPIGPFAPRTPDCLRPPSPPRLGDQADDRESQMSFSSADSGSQQEGKKTRLKRAKVIDVTGGAKAIQAGPLVDIQQNRDEL